MTTTSTSNALTRPLRRLHSWATSLRTFLFPDYCPSCDSRLPTGSDALCPDCLSQLTLTPFVPCEANDMERMFWGQFRLAHAYSYLYYAKDNPSAALVHDIKYHDRPDKGKHLAQRLSGKLLATSSFFSGIDIIVPVPLAKGHHRNYNQALWIARGISAATSLPIYAKSLVRVRHGASQTRLSPSMRKENVRGAFVVADASLIAGRHVLLVDDVMTTGSTLIECARALEAYGASCISIFTLAVSINIPRSPLAYAEKLDRQDGAEGADATTKTRTCDNSNSQA